MATCEYCTSAGPDVVYSVRLRVNLCPFHQEFVILVGWAIHDPTGVKQTLFSALDRGLPITMIDFDKPKE